MKAVYRCIECGAVYKIEPERMLCASCSALQRADEPLRGLLEVEYDGRLPADWDIFHFLPVEPEYFPPIPVGHTPLWKPENLRKETGFPELYLKDDGSNPTGSFKDRASFLVAAFARKHGIRDIVVASTGNAGSSMAGVGAAAGLNVRLYLPESAPEAKLVQSLQYGAQLIRVKGNYDEAYKQSMEYVSTHGGLSRNTAHNPLTIEGKKTVSLEIYRQLGKKLPDFLFVSVGDGVIISGVYKGLDDLHRQGLIERIPTVIAVQAEGSSAISRALSHGEFQPPVPASTIADSISVDVPKGGYFALKKLREHKGEAVTVSDKEILRAQHTLARSCGLFTEPAGAAAAAGFFKLREKLSSKAVYAVLLTGSGLKDIASARKGVMG
ncbi:MAG: pyridoxal-5'-phosphate-dependent protein subunit beta [Spirochaeta sp. LUC14_002_19_P3]|nr:MAG: pyridoxal-5'-phosphate-dependent protein subunit beta [Spirochaeta sp. LUC14_002_19_P3]